MCRHTGADVLAPFSPLAYSSSGEPAGGQYVPLPNSPPIAAPSFASSARCEGSAGAGMVWATESRYSVRATSGGSWSRMASNCFAFTMSSPTTRALSATPSADRASVSSVMYVWSIQSARAPLTHAVRMRFWASSTKARASSTVGVRVTIGAGVGAGTVAAGTGGAAGGGVSPPQAAARDSATRTAGAREALTRLAISTALWPPVVRRAN